MVVGEGSALGWVHQRRLEPVDGKAGKAEAVGEDAAKVYALRRGGEVPDIIHLV